MAVPRMVNKISNEILFSGKNIKVMQQNEINHNKELYLVRHLSSYNEFYLVIMNYLPYGLPYCSSSIQLLGNDVAFADVGH